MKVKLLVLMAMLFAGLTHAQQAEDDPMEDQGQFFYAQDSAVRYSRAEFMDLLFGAIPADWYPSGILYDKSMDSSNIHLYPGVSDQIADYGQWLGIHQALRHARPDNTALLTLNQVLQKAARLYYDLPGDTTTVFAKEWIHIPVGVQRYSYQRLMPEAIAEGRIENGPVQVTPSGPDDIGTYTAFIAAPMFADSIFYDEVWFSMPDKNGFLYGNLGEPNLYQVDFGDGNGLVEMQPGTRRKVVYTPGPKTITIRARYGQIWQSNRASLYVAGSSQTRYALRGGAGTDTTYMDYVMGKMEEKGYKTISCTTETGEQVSGYYRTALGCRNTSGKIKRPVLLITGYNPLWQKDLMDQTEAWNAIGLIYHLLQRNYDVVIFRPASGVDHIANNAAITRKLIEVVNAEKQSADSYEENVVVGFSAGALAARYALAWMEKLAFTSHSYSSHPHTRLFVSWEGEHQGAHVPLGVQHNLTYVVNNMPLGVIPLPSVLNATHLLGSRTARDFLVYHRAQTGSSWGQQGAHPDRATYLANLSTKSHAYTENPANVYARYMRKVSIASGDGDATAHNIGYGQTFADMTKITAFSWNWFWKGVTSRVKSYSLQSGSNKRVFYAKKDYVFYIWEEERKVSQPAKDLDRCPGSTNHFLDQYLFYANEAYRLPTGWYNAHHYTPDCFVPTVSALDIQNHGGNLFYNVRANGLLGNLSKLNGQLYDNQYFGYPHLKHPTDYRSYTPYDAVFVHKGNKKHTPEDDLFELREFLLDEAANDTLWLQNREVGKHIGGQWCARVDITAAASVIAGRNATYTAAAGIATIEPATTVRMTARNTIEWLPGFEAKSGSVVTTTLDPGISYCNPPSGGGGGGGGGSHQQRMAPEPAAAPTALVLSPNPASSEVSLTLAEMQEIRILTLTGTEVFAQTLTDPVSAITLPIGSYPAGIYLVQVTTRNGIVFTQKLMVQPR